MTNPTCVDGPPDELKTEDVRYFDPAFPGHGPCLPINAMTPEQFALFSEDYYLGIIVPDVFEVDANGDPIAPHGMSIHGVPKLRPEDE